MSRTDPQVNVRMPQELIDDLKIQAIKNRRSLTAQLNQIVEEWLKEQKQQESAKA
ncbi:MULTISPECIES: Arc family DNA-binding protein [Acinetobacter]|uniref:Arc family DNA-binding protein n=1 Tax=Acinetobacter TaxID=469 RepID=UPI0015DB3B67|nr:MULTISPECIES: Arc family DNA-binding protein [Acinetobacter]MCU4350240.1 Arc family DNA-binding protein [Acinetobacter ursingii]